MNRRAWGVLLVAAGLTLGCGDATEDQEVFQAALSGGGEVPARATTATGAAGVVIDGDRLHFSVEVVGINNVTASHIHVGPATGTGPVRLNFFLGPTQSFEGRTIMAQGTATAADAVGISFDQLLNEIRSGNAYVNVHTTQFPGGEIRGQLVPVSTD